MQIRWMKFLLFAALLAAGMLAIAPWCLRQTPSKLADFWRSQILEADEVDALRWMPELTRLGDPGTRVLAELIGSQHAAMSAKAQSLLAAEVDRWLELDSGPAAERLDVLVAALAERIDTFGPIGRQFAEELVERLLRGDTAGHRLVSDTALPACQRILEAAAEDHRNSRQVRRGPSAEEVEAVLAPYPIVEPAPVKLAAPSAKAPAIEPETAVETTPAPLAEANASERVEVLSPDAEIEAMREPAPLDLEPDPLQELPELPNLRHPRGGVRRTQLTQPSDNPLRPLAPEETRIINWIRELKSPDPRVAQQAERRLTESGFGDRELALARRLVLRDPSEREKLAEELPRVPGIDAKIWLLWLARDERAEVRRAAIGVMATINDPELAREIQEIARRDPDRRVQEQGERIKAMRSAIDGTMRR